MARFFITCIIPNKRTIMNPIQTKSTQVTASLAIQKYKKCRQVASRSTAQTLRRRICWVIALACVAFLMISTSHLVYAKIETTVQRLHRKGVHCMEEIERSECAIEHFETLINEDTREQTLVTDAILRLIKLYNKTGEENCLRDLLRRFWEAGGQRQRRGHLPYTSRYLPADLDMIGHVDFQRSLKTPLIRRLPSELPEFILTCDDTRRKVLGEAIELYRAERLASKKGLSKEAAFAQIQAKKAEEQRKKEQFKKEEQDQKYLAGKKVRRTKNEMPIFEPTSACKVARALGTYNMATWVRATVAVNHLDFSRSAAIVQVPHLDNKIAKALASGTIQVVDSHRYRIVDHAGAFIEIASFDLDELTIASPTMMTEIASAFDRRKSTLNREIKKLLAATPSEVVFLGVATAKSLQDLVFRKEEGRRRRLLEALLPRPDGIQIVGVAHEYLGVFLRMPNKDPVKTQLFVDFANKFINSDENKDLKNLLDFARASDRHAFLVSYIMAPGIFEDQLLD